MSSENTLNWKFDEYKFEKAGLSLEIIDRIEILKFTELEGEEFNLDLSSTNSDFNEMLADRIYEKVAQKEYKGSLKYICIYKLL